MKLFLKMILIAFSMHIIPFKAMEKPKEEKNLLAQKFPHPIDWKMFEQENLRDYKKRDLDPFLLHAVIQRAPLKVVKKLLDDEKVSTEVCDEKGNSALCLAIMHDNFQAAQALVKRNARIEYENPYRIKQPHEVSLDVLTCAFLTNDVKYVRLILDRTPAPDSHGSIDLRTVLRSLRLPGGTTPIFYAMAKKNIPLFNYLHQKDPELATSVYNGTPGPGELMNDRERLSLYVSYPDIKPLEALFTHIRLFVNCDKDFLLYRSVAYNNLPAAKLLLEHEATPQSGMLALAARKGNLEMAQLLIEHGINPNKPIQNYEEPPLCECITQDSSMEAVEMLIQLGAEPDVKTHEGKTPLMQACTCGNPDATPMIKRLLEAGAAVNGIDKKGRTALHYSCEQPDIGIMKVLLDAHAHVDAEDAHGFTPLMLLCQSEYPRTEMVQLLLQHGANPNASAQNNFTPLIAASYYEIRMPVIHALLKAGADIDASKDQMLLRAASGNNLTLVSLLLDKQANANIREKNGATPLIEMMGRYSGHSPSMEIARLLIKHGADVNAIDEAGNTALHHVVTYGRREEYKQIAELLVNAGAAVNLKNKKGITPVISAATGNHTALLELLLKNGGDAHEVDNDGKTIMMKIIATSKAKDIYNSPTVQLLLQSKKIVKP